MVLRTALLFALLAGVGALRAHADEHELQGAHYRLQFEGARGDADEALRVLEAAWPSFRAFFDAEPTLAEGERLRVRFYGSREAWVRGIHADGTQAPAGAGGYYWPPTRTAHLYRQPTQYFTRTLLVHEAAHQFHYLARTRNAAPAAGWYTEGIAEHLSWHRWDGARLELGVLPGVSLKDYPAAALREIEAPDFDLAAVVGGTQHASRPVAWAVLRFLATGREGRPLARFDSFRRKMDLGAAPWPTFKSHFGRPGRLQPRLLAWLREHQTPWAQVFNEWEQVGPGAFRGHAGVVSACRLKQAASTLEAVLELPVAARRWRAGLLLHWSDNEDYTVALVSAGGRVVVDRRRAGRWQRLHDSRRPAAQDARERRLRAERAGGEVAFWLDGARVGAWSLPGSSLGLAVDNGDVRFRAVARSQPR